MERMHDVPEIIDKGCCILNFSMMVSLFLKYMMCLRQGTPLLFIPRQLGDETEL